MASLPPPKHNQPYCVVSALEAGTLDLYLKLFVADSDPKLFVTAPSLSFLLHHSVSKDHLLFDLGIRRNTDSFPPAIQERLTNYPNVTVAQDVADSLNKGGLSPADIRSICVSHCHWDHVGDASLFPNASFLLGKDAASLFAASDADEHADPHLRFSRAWFPWDRVNFLDSDDWKPLGPFPRALDFYNDGSLYLVDAPGHLPGHTNLLARTSPDGAWLFLAADSAHHWSLLTDPDAKVAEYSDQHGNHVCAHHDKALAEAHIARIRELAGLPRVQVMLAHDEPWFRENRGGPQFWPGYIPPLP